MLKKIGLRIKQLRTERGLSQNMLGLEIDMEKSNVSRMESGTVNVKVGTLHKVSKAFDITLSDLVNIK